MVQCATSKYTAPLLLLFIVFALFIVLPQLQLVATAAVSHVLVPRTGIVTGEILDHQTRANYEEQLHQQLAHLEELEFALGQVQAENARLAEEQAGQQGEQGGVGGEGGDSAGGLQSMEMCFEEILRGERDLPLAAEMLEHYLQNHGQQLQERWDAQLSGQRQRGIVVPAGGDESISIHNAFVVLYVLRHHLRSSLPVVIMYWGGKGFRDNVGENTRAIFQEHISGLQFIDTSEIAYPTYHRPLSPESSGTNAGWKIKAFSLYAAPFREVLLLDSDSVPLLDPSCLFEIRQYTERGSFFWRDCCLGNFTMGSQKLFRMLGLDDPFSKGPPLEFQTESGMFLFDRSRHWKVLEWVLFLNSREDVVYSTTYGDKETYRVAFHLAGNGADFQQVGHNVAYTMSLKNGKQSMIQLLPNGTAMFHHLSPLLKYYAGRRSPLPTLISARATAEHGQFLAIYWQLHAGKVARVGHGACNYSLWDWPAAERACAPKYDYLLSKDSHPLPVFEAPPNSHLTAAMTVADEGFLKFRAAKHALAERTSARG